MRLSQARPVVLALFAVCFLAWPTGLASPAGRPADLVSRVPFTDWPTYHRDATRTGFDPATPPIQQLSRAWTTSLDGAVYAEPLVVAGRVIAATESDTVYALDPTTGAILWHRHLGTPVPLSRLPCGNIDPLGITGTPVYDPATNRLFVALERLNSTGGIQHRLFGLDPANGTVVGTRIIDPPGSDPTVEQQRAALAVGNGRVYIAFGALAGDCGDYHGYVVAERTSFTRGLAVYSAQQYVPGATRGGIWATPGPSVDSSGKVFVAVGNGTTSGNYDLSDAILRLSPSLAMQDYFAPSTWQQDNINDADLGSTGPALVPGGQVYADGKSGTGYLLNHSQLGHIGGQLAMASVCVSFGGTALLQSRLFVPCTDGIRAVDVQSGSFQVRWHASDTHAAGPPVVGGGAVWSLGIGTGILYALDPNTGATLASLSVGSVEHFATPTLSGGEVFVPLSTGVLAVKGA